MKVVIEISRDLSFSCTIDNGLLYNFVRDCSLTYKHGEA